jgi:UDP-N-acetylglucosamine acyltransferase
MARIHPLASVDAAATIDDDAEIGPFCVVGPHVSIAAGARLIAHVHVEGHTAIGPRTIVYPHTALGTAPQSVGYRGGPTRLVIGADCKIREGVTMNIGTEDGGGVTEVGDRGFFMANAHVAHDCRVGSDVIFANCATLGGHCLIGNHVFIGGLSAVHQFTRIGDHAMIGGVSGIRGDVIPFGLASGEHARMIGVNVVGMKRRNFARASIAAVRKAYRMFFLGTGSLDERLNATEAAFGSEAAVAGILSFIRGRGKRVLCQPGSNLLE